MTDNVPQLGRDELNLAEFPIGLLSERVPSGMKTLEFEGQHGKLTVRGAEGLGLPTARDTDVIIGLLQITKTHSNFTDETTPFTPHALLTMMGWPNQGHSYKRLRESLHRWMGTTLFYQGAWYDNSLRCRIDASMHILDNVVMFDGDVRRTLRARQQALPLSSFTWGKRFFQSCQDGNLKRLDVGIYFGLRSAVTKQVYRHLDKRFYIKPDWTFDLREFGFGQIGLSRNYSDAKLKEKLKPAIEELKAIGFLKSVAYANPKRGSWTIRVIGNGRGEPGHRSG